MKRSLNVRKEMSKTTTAKSGMVATPNIAKIIITFLFNVDLPPGVSRVPANIDMINPIIHKTINAIL